MWSTTGTASGSYSFYNLPLASWWHGLKCHMYADDCQLYTAFSMSTNDTVSSMQMAINDIRAWYAANMLKLNDDKTEMLILGSQYHTIPKLPDLNVGSTVSTPGEHVRNLGVIMDAKFTMEPYINKTMQIAFLKNRLISYYRKFLTPSAVQTLIHDYITSRLDYCNGLLHGLPTNLITKLQSILNTAARLVTKTLKYEHIIPVMINLHWLPIQYRIQFKMLLLIYKYVHGLAPSYLTEKLSLRPNKGLRSDNQLLLNLTVSTLRLKFYGNRTVSVAGPTLWNALPKDIRLCATLTAFKTSLKTYLFKKAYKLWLCTLLIYFTSDLFLRFTLIFYFIISLYQLCQSLVIIECYILMLYHDCITLI